MVKNNVITRLKIIQNQNILKSLDIYGYLINPFMIQITVTKWQSHQLHVLVSETFINQNGKQTKITNKTIAWRLSLHNFCHSNDIWQIEVLFGIKSSEKKTIIKVGVVIWLKLKYLFLCTNLKSSPLISYARYTYDCQ